MSSSVVFFVFFCSTKKKKKKKKTHLFFFLFQILPPKHFSHPSWVVPFLGLTAIFSTLSMVAANQSVSFLIVFSFGFFSKNLTFLTHALSLLSKKTNENQKQLNLVDAWGAEGTIRKRVQTMFAGFLILAAGLMALLFGLGAAMEGRRDEDEDYEGGKRGYERGGGAGAQRTAQPTVTYGAPTGAATGGVPLRTAGAAP